MMPIQATPCLQISSKDLFFNQWQEVRRSWALTLRVRIQNLQYIIAIIMGRAPTSIQRWIISLLNLTIPMVWPALRRLTTLIAIIAVPLYWLPRAELHPILLFIYRQHLVHLPLLK